MECGEKSNIALKAENLTIGYRSGRRTIAVASGLNLELIRGRVVALLGANGIGKSTLLRTLAGQQAALSGSIQIDGRALAKLLPAEIARKISVVYTERTISEGLTVRETVGMGRQPYTGFFGRLSRADREIVDQSMAAVGIEALADKYMGNISDGERQKAMIGRALAQQTPTMILDEPTSFLDVASRLEVVGLLSRLAHDLNKSVLLTTHDIADALSIADDLWLLRSDCTLLTGSKDRLLADRAMDGLFAGDKIYFDYQISDYRLSINEL